MNGAREGLADFLQLGDDPRLERRVAESAVQVGVEAEEPRHGLVGPADWEVAFPVRPHAARDEPRLVRDGREEQKPLREDAASAGVFGIARPLRAQGHRL